MHVLAGMTWDHRRAISPLVETLSSFRARHPDITVEWTARPLHGFEFEPVADLARRCDLIILDHPFCGNIAASGALMPLDPLLEGLDRLFVGPSLESYRYDGHIWALPVDAAAQVAVSRPDLMDALDSAPPATWTELLRLGEAARRRGWSLAIALKGVHSLMTFFTLCANLGQPCATSPDEPFVDRSTAHEALTAMRALLALCPADVLDWNSIALHDAMVESDTLAFCPAVYCYATYAEADQRRPLRFHDLPGLAGPTPRGSTIGGAGLGISIHCRAPEAALAYARFLLDPDTQRAFADHHGQPARIEAWSDEAADKRFGGCFSSTLKTMQHCWIRPRYDGYLAFQARGGTLIEQHLRGGLGEAELLAELDRAHRSAAG